ncbi:MAG: insulinase family protein [SAR324 cluster bacterium]|nr:insulinase family protein [SAR324 cluster bacterium]
MVAVGCKPRQLEQSPQDKLLAETRTEVAYRKLVLENGLRVMLISDAEAERSAAAMAVAAGSLEDPEEHAGMAHFLEHMLFLGTEKYPQAGEYQKYLTTHAGYSNAYTSNDHTNYFFQVAHPAFTEALDRFAQFFSAPLFNEEYVQREVNAVASEHSKNVDNDMWRVSQIKRSLYRADHPINRFSTGNLETLAGVDRQRLLDFYTSRYSANVMTLAVLGNRGLDELEATVRDRFEELANRNLSRPRYARTYLDTKPALRVVTVEPVKDQRSLIVEFPLPPTRQHYDAKPGALMGFLLGHEGAGSLLSLLKSENLATTLAAGIGEETVDYASFSMRFGLTSEGLERYQDILSYMFGAINYFRDSGLPRYIFDENRVMAEIDFKYRSRPESARRASFMSALMLAIPMEELPEAVFSFKRYDPDLVGMYLDYLRPDNMLVTLVAKDVPTDRIEKYYQAKFGYRESTGDEYTKLIGVKPDPRIRMPERNPFIPHSATPGRPDGPMMLAGTSFHYLAQDGLPAPLMAQLEELRDVRFTGLEAFMRQTGALLDGGENGRYLPSLLKSSHPLPTRLMDNTLGRVWFLPDWRFNQPKGKIILKFRTGKTYQNPRQAVLGHLYQESLAEALNEFAYPVHLAGLDYGVEAGKTGIVLTLSGYAPRMLDLLTHLADTLSRIDIGEAAFAAIKEKYQRGLQNRRYSQPYMQSAYFRRLLLRDPTFSLEDLERELETVTRAEVLAYAESLYERVYLEGVVVGDLDARMARTAISRILVGLSSQPLPEQERTEEEIRRLPPNADYVYTHQLDVNNSLISLIYQVGKTDPTLRGGLLIISRALRNSFYQNMRTRQQLGYIVFSGMGQMKKTLSLNFLVQSGAYGVDTLLQRMEAYIPQFVSEFKSMSGDEFERLRTAVIDAKLKRASNIGEVAERLNWIAFENDEKFDHVSEDIEAAERISRSQVETILDRALVADGAKRLVIRLIGDDHTAGRPRGTPIDSPDLIQAAGG